MSDQPSGSDSLLKGHPPPISLWHYLKMNTYLSRNYEDVKFCWSFCGILLECLEDSICRSCGSSTPIYRPKEPR